MGKLTKPVVAVVAGLSLLVGTAPASSASTGNFASGTLTINLIPSLVITLAAGACWPANLHMSSSGSGPSYSVTSTLELHRPFIYQGSAYVITSLDGTAHGSISSSSGIYSSGGFASTVGNIYRADASNTCLADLSQPMCAGVALSSSSPVSLSGSFSGTVSPPGVVGTVNLGGSGRFAASGCGAPFAALNNRTGTFSGSVSVV